MATHLRGWAYQAGAFLALIGAFIFVAPTPAQAADPTVTIDNPTTANLRAGERVRLNFQVKNNSTVPQQFDVTVASTIDELVCRRNCEFTTQPFAPGQAASFDAELVADPMEAGRSESGRVEIQAVNGRDRGSSGIDVTVRGDDRPPQVDKVSGRIRDQDGKAIAGAEVAMQDSQGHQYSTRSSSSGAYRFESSERTPISPGSITVGAQKDGFTRSVQTTTAETGRSATVNLTMRSLAAPSPSASPSPTVSPSATPADEVSEDTATEQPPAPAQQPAGADANDDGSSSLLFVILGGLLVAAGVGAIVLVLMRRKDTDDDGADPDDVASGLPAGGVVPPSQGRYGGVPDATRVAGPVGGHPADATMVASPALPPSISDAPTMLQQAVPADEFPDPYGAPNAVPHAGYAAARPGGWGPAGAAGAGGYGPPQYGTAPAPDSAYGAPAGQYGATGAYGAPAGPAAPPPPGGYGAPAGGNPYARPPVQGGGHRGDQRFDEPTGWYNPDAGAGQHGSPAAPERSGGHQAQEPGTATGSFRPEPGTATGSFRPQPPAGQAPVPTQPHEPVYGRGTSYGGGQQHEPPAAGGYQSGGGYPPAAGSGYAPEQGNGYGSWAPQGGGVDGGDAYGAPGYGGGYATPPGRETYDETTGYDPRAGYGRPDGYGHAPAQPDRGPVPPPDQRRPGYGEVGSYYGGDQAAPPGGQPGPQPPESTHPGRRRPLDWLDD